ncbi:YfhO family protein [Staphylococcus epidermidis]|nr:YfhO family protein [Staphylococcus epidermidis]
MRRKACFIILLITLSLIGHSYIIFRFHHDGVLSTGPNDGMEQMIPIQMYLYHQWTQGNLFYSTHLGLGGDFFTDLSYYFSTNLIFILNVPIIKLCEIFFSLNTNQILLWMYNALIVSIIKSTIALFCTYLFSYYISKNKIIGLLISFIFVISPLYFRFTIYWPFFSDTFIWLPLLLLGIERLLRDFKVGLFILTVSLILINNFYFAYYFLIIGIGYTLIRIIYRHPKDSLTRWQASLTIICSALLALGNSMFVFFHGVQSFLNNRRQSFTGQVNWIEHLNKDTNIFFDNYLIVVIFLSIQALLTIILYKHFYYKLFALLLLATIIFAFLPFVDQLFNGFSAPQKRWHFILAFNSSILIGLFVKYFKTIRPKTYIYTNLIAQSVIYISSISYNTFLPWLSLVPVVSVIGLLILLIKEKKVRYYLTYLYSISIAALSLMITFVFIKNQIFFQDHINRANKRYINSSFYSSTIQRSLVKEMNQTKNDDQRINWRVDEQDNTPMYQNFKGLSIYSSIFHHNILDFYYDALKINLAEESVSRYQSTNARQNIESLFSVKYLMMKDYQNFIPSYFKKVKSRGQYIIYKNQLPLPSVKVTQNIYNHKSLKKPIDREHAMINGAIVTSKGTAYHSKVKNLLDQTRVSTQNITRYSNNELTVNKESGIIKLHLPKNIRDKYKDFYLTMNIKRGDPDSNYTVSINQYHNHRLYNDSIYRTGISKVLYRSLPDKNGDITIQLSPKGKFNLELLELNGENYDTLKQAHHHANFNMRYKDIKNGVKVNLDHHSKGLAVINIPYRKGMRAYVDDRQSNIKKVNYMMTGVPVNKNNKTITIQYRPPFLKTMFSISIFSIVVSIVFIRLKNIRKRKMRIRHD